MHRSIPWPWIAFKSSLALQLDNKNHNNLENEIMVVLIKYAINKKRRQLASFSAIVNRDIPIFVL